MSHTGIAIVWPAWFPGSVDPELHCTALFLGRTDTVDYTEADLDDAISDNSSLVHGWHAVQGLALFGYNLDIPVLTLNPRDLQAEHTWLAAALEVAGIKSSSDYGFNPHVTVAREPENSLGVHLQAPVIWWGDSRPIHTRHALEASK